MSLPILRLPQNAQIKTIEQMKPIQQLGFSTLSNKTKTIVASSNLELKRVELYFREKCGMYLFFGWYGNLKYVEIEFRSNYRNQIVRVVAHAEFDDDDTREYDFFRNWSSDNFRTYLDYILFVINSSKQINQLSFSSNDYPFCTRYVHRQILRRFSEVDSFRLSRNPYETVTGTHGFLMRNLNDFRLDGHNNEFKFTLNDLLVSNSKKIVTGWSGWTEKTVNRFLKLWIKGSNPNLKILDIWFPREHLINEDIVLKGIVTHEVRTPRFLWNHEEYRYGLKRKDGTLAVLSVQSTNINIPHIQLDVDSQK
ncbi:unnamed protein product [Caenorhabditis brenneri]